MGVILGGGGGGGDWVFSGTLFFKVGVCTPLQTMRYRHRQIPETSTPSQLSSHINCIKRSKLVCSQLNPKDKSHIICHQMKCEVESK